MHRYNRSGRRACCVMLIGGGAEALLSWLLAGCRLLSASLYCLCAVTQAQLPSATHTATLPIYSPAPLSHTPYPSHLVTQTSHTQVRLRVRCRAA